jgi:hypothetical protein
LPIRVLDTDLYVLNMHTRMPFRYGITTLTAVPHLFVRATVEIDGKRQVGLSADHLPPKWFTKNPDTSPREDIAGLLEVISAARDVARATPKQETVFGYWRRMYEAMSAWGGGWAKPPLLVHFGTSLVERAVIDAFCRIEGTTFGQALRKNWFGVDLGALHRELNGMEPASFLPPEPLRSLVSRHTVGLTDPLTDADVTAGERVDDGLPQSLEACVRAYGLTHFKIKLWGDAARDHDRLRGVADVIERQLGPEAQYAFTLDGNENFKAIDPFRKLWDSLVHEPSLSRFMTRLLFVEQPLHRDVALGDEVKKEFLAWSDRPPVIIDESDGEISSAARALSCGYAGTSHKNCKGVFKSVANAGLIARRRRENPAGRFVLSGEDLSNIGPVSLLQDTAVVASLGIEHAERNGHHYFKGLSALPEDVQAAALRAHGDVYRRHERGFVTSRVERGRTDVASVVDAPFGVDFDFDPSQFTPVDRWSYDTLEPA